MDKYSKILMGQVLGVSAVTNTVMVRIPEITETVTIPLTYPYISSLSGIKFLPRVGDVVMLAYSPQLVPKILGYELMKAQHFGNQQNALDGKLHYRELEPGDILLYSGYGETEVFLSNQGVIQLASGVNIIKLDAVRGTIEGICRSYQMKTTNGIQANIGYVQRIIPPNLLPQGIPGTVAFELGILGLTGKIMEMKTGTVINDLGLPEVGANALPKVFSLKVFEGILPLGEIYMNQGMLGLTSAGEVMIDAPLIQLGGLLAIHPAVRGDLLVTLLTTLITEVFNLGGYLQPKDDMDAPVAVSRANVIALLEQLAELVSVKTKVD